jgi:hypothetical protein
MESLVVILTLALVASTWLFFKLVATIETRR